MMRLGVLFLSLTALASDTRSFPLPEFQSLSVTEGDSGPLRLVGRTETDRRDCSPIRTQESIWADAASKSPMAPRPRLGLAVGIGEKAFDLWSRQCMPEAFALLEKAAAVYGQTVQLAAGDNSNTGRTFRLQARMNLAEIYIKIHEFDAAREVLLATLNERDAYLPAIVRLAEVELRAGSPEAALAVTNRLAGKQYQEDIGGLSVGRFFAIRAEAHCKLGMADEANREIQIARRNDPNVPEARCRV